MQPDLQKFNQRGLALLLQGVLGTPETPDPAVDGIRLYDGSSKTDHDTDESNPDRPFFGGNEIATYNHRIAIEGGFRIYAPNIPGDAAQGDADAHRFLLPAGMTRVLDAIAGTTRYNPITTGIPISTAYFWHAGTHVQAFDMRHAISSLTMEIGKRYGGQIRLQGSYNDVLEEDLPQVITPDDESVIVSADNSHSKIRTLGGADVVTWAKSLVIDFGSDVKTKEYTQHKETGIDGRKPTFKFRIARTAKADFDPWKVMRDGTYIEASMRVVDADSLYAEQGVRGQISDVQPVDIDGDYGWEITGNCVPSDTGGDEFYIEFGTHV